MSKSLASPLTPPAVRATRAGWRDPRLWVGVVLVAASVLMGAKLLGDADHSVALWVVSSDMGPGDAVGSADVVARDVRFVQDDDVGRYLTADEPLPPDARLTRDVGAGELLPRSALGSDSGAVGRTLTFAFEGPGIPAGLGQGDRVEVFVTSVEADPKVAAGATPEAELVLSGLVVTELTRAEVGLTATGGRTVSVSIPPDADPRAVAVAVQAAKTDNVFLIKQG